ncbi:AhpC/TSA family protein [bacterium A37T11]|nr:AhpC/TSA family protein [bacterium A37T11]
MKDIKAKYLGVVFAVWTLTMACSGNQRSAENSDGSQNVAASKESENGQFSSSASDAQPARKEPAATIPDFTFYKLNSGMAFTKQDLSVKGNIVFILFDPDCSHCQHEAGMLGTAYSRIKNAHLYFISMMDPNIMSGFFDRYAKQLKDKDNVMMLYDRKAEFINKIHVPDQYPATYVYGKDGRLKEYWNGDRDIEKIITSINQG